MTPRCWPILSLPLLLVACVGSSWDVTLDTDLSGGGGPVLLGTTFTLSVSRNPHGPLFASSQDSDVLRLIQQDTCSGSSVRPGVVDDWHDDMEDCQGGGQSWDDCEELLGPEPDEPRPRSGDDCPTWARLEAVGEGTTSILWRTSDGYEADRWRAEVSRAARLEAVPVELDTRVPIEAGEVVRIFHSSPLGLEVRYYADGSGQMMRRRDPLPVLFGDTPPDAARVEEWYDVYSVEELPEGLDAVRFDMPLSDDDFELPVAVAREADVDDVRIRAHSTARRDDVWLCYRLEAYGRTDGEPVAGVPIEWFAGPVVRLLPRESRAAACVPDETLPEPVIATAAFPAGPVTERWLQSDGGPIGERDAAITGVEAPPGQDEPERAEGAIGCSAVGAPSPAALTLALLALAGVARRMSGEVPR